MELLEASGKGDIMSVRQIMIAGLSVDVIDQFGRTPLIRASARGDLDMVRCLVEHGASMDGQDNSGETPLIWAAYRGHLNVVRFLVEHGATLDAHDNSGETPLITAARRGHLDVTWFLVEHGADVEAHDSNGWTSLTWAARCSHLNVVRFLVEHEANLNSRDNDGETPLMRATGGGLFETVQYLVEHRAAVDASSSDGRTPLIRASARGDLDMVRCLVEHGASVDCQDNSGETPLIWAAHRNHLNVVRFLVEHGADVNAHGSDCGTPLMIASRDGHMDVVRFLVKHGANSNLKSSVGNTALSSASTFGRQEVVQFLRPLVRYKDQRTQIEFRDEYIRRPSNIPSNWLIPPFEIEVEPNVDRGYTGGDYRGKWLDADVVVKLFIDDATSTSFVDEVRLWHQLRHPNILKLYGVCDTAHHLFICEYASKGSLPEYLKLCDSKRRTLWKFLYEAALGLEYLHERKVVHGNLRGSNILIGSDGLAKLSGFGLSASSTKESWYKSGTWMRWASPEAMRNNKVTFASDVYSLGMCIVEAASGKVPYNAMNETKVRYAVKYESTGMKYLKNQLGKLFDEQRDLVVAMCRDEPHARLQMPTVVNKLERFAEMEAIELTQHTDQPEPEQLVTFDAFDVFNHGKTSSLWIEVQSLVAQCKNDLYCQMWHELELITETLKAKSHLWSTIQRSHDLLDECRRTLDTMSKQNQVRRLSATRARDFSIQGLHRRISQLLDYVCPKNCDAETRETEWKRLCREQVEVFVSETSETYVVLNSVDSEEDRLALIAVLHAELHNIDGKYTNKQLSVLQKTYNEYLSKSLEDVQLATTPEWFIPWFELEMDEMATLGEGGFGSVIKARWLDSEVVVKKLEINANDAVNADKKREMRQMFEHEVDIWFGLSHPHVVRLFGACHVGRPFFVCELAPNGTLNEYLRKHPDELWSKLREAALGVQYLHARGIVHGDLKGNNILIGSDGKAKVTDFGLSGVFGDDSTEMVLSGAWHWVAPECLTGEKPMFSSDVYSLGMCIIEALRVTNGAKYYLPWGDLPNLAVKFHATKNILPQRPSNCTDETWTLIESMCKSDPADRMLIMTVVDELEKLADWQGGLINETDQIVSDIGKMQLLTSGADKIAEMKNVFKNCAAKQDWEDDVLEKIYLLLWNRLEHVGSQLFPDSDDTVVSKSKSREFTVVVELSIRRTLLALDISGALTLIKFTELALGGYALHRRLDKFMAAHTVSTYSSTLHDWTSACSSLMGVSTSPYPAYIEEDYIAGEVKASSMHLQNREYTMSTKHLTYVSSLSIDLVREAQMEIDGYFIKQAELTDLSCQQEVMHALDTWLEKIKSQVIIASESALDYQQQKFSADNMVKLLSVLEALLNEVEQLLQASAEECKASATALLAKRQGLAESSFVEIQHILTTFGIVLPVEMKPKISTVAVNTASEHDFLYGLNAWLAKMTDPMESLVIREVKQAVRIKVVPGSVYDAEHYFGDETTSDQVEIKGRFIAGDYHVILGLNMDLQMSCQVGSAFAGQSFVLELSHLTSDAGPDSRAPVTISVNGHVIRENFCPRTTHEQNGNKVGVWWYVTDRWQVNSSFVHEGVNIVSISYCNHGTSCYWIRSLGLHCAIPRLSTAMINTRDVKKVFDTEITSRMLLGQEQKLLFERVLQETSPILDLKATFQQYISLG